MALCGTIILALGIFVACSPSSDSPPIPTDIPRPLPTATPVPTPDATATLEAIVEGLTDSKLSATQVPNASSVPTPTRVPTPTPRPTFTPRPTPTPTPIAVPSYLRCETEWFIDEIVALSKENEVEILKIYSGAEQLERTNLLLRCVAEVRVSRRDYSYIIYHYELDRDGDAFIGYELSRSRPEPAPTPTPVPTPTPTPVPSKWTLHVMNSYSVEIPINWEKAFENIEERGGVIVFLDPQEQIQLRVFHYYFEEGTSLIALEDVANISLSSDSEEPNYALTSLRQTSSSTMRSQFTYKSSLMDCEVKAYGLHVLLPNDIFFVSLRICTFATSEYDTAFIERIMAGFSYFE